MRYRNVSIVLTVFLILAFSGLYYCMDDDESGTYVLITIDTERDFPPYLGTYKGIDEGIPIILDLFEEYGVKATFLVTGNVAKYDPKLVEDISSDHEIGNHSLYHIDPLYSLSFEEKYERIEESTRILEEITGDTITSFRSPGHSCDSELLEILESFGYLVEASAYGGDSYPYYPSCEDWTKPGEMDILRVPVSNATNYFYPFFLYGASWVDAYLNVMESQIDKDIKMVVIGMHPWEFCELELGDDYESTERICGDETINKLTELLEYLEDKDVEYITLSQAYDLFS